MEIGVRDLKARLSEVIDRAASGETIVVTSYGKPKAAIGPVPAETRIQQGIREGWIRPGNGEPPEIPRRRYRGRMTIDEALLEDRGE
jgi:prevent-host-death family protein